MRPFIFQDQSCTCSIVASNPAKMPHCCRNRIFLRTKLATLLRSSKAMCVFMVIGAMIYSSSSFPCIFVYGALRSGTTLLRLMLKNHPGLQSPGEGDFLFDHITGGDGAWRYNREALARDRIFKAKDLSLPDGVEGKALSDHLIAEMAAKDTGHLHLSIHRNAPTMKALFPNAKIIHLLRDPRDVARSSIGMGWAGNSYYGVDHWMGTERDWDAAAYPETEVLTVHYETLMADLEGELTRICEFLGLPFEPAMLKYYENSSYGPPDPGIAQKWKVKAGAREIALIEGRAGSLLEARGYEPAGAPALPGGFEKLRLDASNRLGRWRHNIRRYGAGLFFGHHAARVLGLKSVARRLSDRQEAIRIENLQ